MTRIPETQTPEIPPGTAPNASRVPAPVPPTVTSRRYHLPAGTAGVVQARARVRAAVRDWDLPVSEGMAALLTWHLVMSVTPGVSSEGPGGADGTEGPAGPVGPRGAASAGDAPGRLTLGVSCSHGTLRVDVFDERRTLPGRGYEIVASMADDWGIYRTPAGRAVFFTLAFTGPSGGSARASNGPC